MSDTSSIASNTSIDYDFLENDVKDVKKTPPKMTADNMHLFDNKGNYVGEVEPYDTCSEDEN